MTTADEHLLALEYVMNGKIDEMKVLAIIAGTVEAVGIAKFSKVLVDYTNEVLPDEDAALLLGALALDIGVFEE